MCCTLAPLKTLPHLRSAFALLVLGAAGLFGTGCVGVMPVPVLPGAPEYGSKVEAGPARGIRPGQTTRAEVIAKLGTNYVELPRAHAIAYTWEMRGGGGGWWWSFFLPTYFGPAGDADAGKWEGGWRGFFVAFDGNNVVRAAEFKQLSMRRSLDENVDRWAAHLPKSAPANPPSLIRRGLPAGAEK